MSTETGETPRELALEIARCPIIDAALAGSPAGVACAPVVQWNGATPELRYTPEPWNGHLDQAQILFISSNPSADEEGAAVPDGWTNSESTEDAIFDAFDGAFEDGQWPGIADGTRLVGPDGSDLGSIPYWVWMRDRAEELLGRPMRPGLDYALTEVVHCGSKQETGVWEALPVCAERYLSRLLRLSPAALLVFVGAVAKDAASGHLGLDLSSGIWGPAPLLGTERYAIHLMHPAGFGPKSIEDQLGPAGLANLHRFLEGGSAA